MRKNIEISKELLNDIINDFYSYFEDGFAFESFLKLYLEKIGLDEVLVTKRSDDGGIDLTAVRKGIGEFNQADTDKYYIQAKRYKPLNTISPEKIRALRGSFSNGKGIFITTAKVSDKAKSDARTIDPQRPIIVVDGEELVISCIENEIGFIFNPQFSKSAMDSFIKKNNSVSNNNVSAQALNIVKKISNNDIRAKILPIPRAILEIIDNGFVKYEICFNNEYKKELRIDKTRRFFGGVTEAYKKYGLISEDGAFHPTNAKWILNDGKININFDNNEV